MSVRRQTRYHDWTYLSRSWRLRNHKEMKYMCPLQITKLDWYPHTIPPSSRDSVRLPPKLKHTPLNLSPHLEASKSCHPLTTPANSRYKFKRTRSDVRDGVGDIRLSRCLVAYQVGLATLNPWWINVYTAHAHFTHDSAQSNGQATTFWDPLNDGKLCYEYLKRQMYCHVQVWFFRVGSR